MEKTYGRWQAVCLSVAAICLVIGSTLLPISNLTKALQKKVDSTNASAVTPSMVPNRSAATGPLRVLSSNPRYFTDGSGKAILLTGSHTWFTMQDVGSTDPPPAFDYNAFLNVEEANGYNFFRTFSWEQSWKSEGSDFDGHAQPNFYLRTGPGNALDGKPKFDLTQFNPDYFNRIRARVIQARDRGFYVSLMLFEGFSVMDKHGNGYTPYPGHPYNVNNNINGINGDPGGTGDGGQIQTLNIPQITALQEAYVAHLIDTVNDLDNVLFEICNESSGSKESVAWQNHFIDFIHHYESSKPKQHPVGFTVPWPDGNNADLFASHADWISPNDSGYDTYKTNPPAANGSKVIIADTDHLWGLGGSVDWVWKSFTRGLNPIFMDPYSSYASFIWAGTLDPNDPLCVSIRANLRYIQAYANRINLAVMLPRADLCTSGYCLANPAASKAEYLVYLPTSGSVTVDLTRTPGSLAIEWFNPSNGQVSTGNTVSGGAKRLLTAPFTGSAVLYLSQTDITPVATPTPSPTSTPIALSISNVKFVPMDTLAGITWTTNLPSTSQVEYGTTTNLGSKTAEITALSTSHSVQITNLKPKTRYYFKVISKDAGGKTIVSAVFSFTTLASGRFHFEFLPSINFG